LIILFSNLFLSPWLKNQKMGGCVPRKAVQESWRRREMLVRKAQDRVWSNTDVAGIERSLFRHNDAGGRTSVVRLAAGSRFPRHSHDGGEDVVVLEGKVRIGGVELGQGDYLFTGAGEEHDVSALTDAIIFVSSQKATPWVE